jgi:nucleoside-diphosphate-sugar epimerase
MKTVLVTGITGKIGANIALTQLNRGYHSEIVFTGNG